jgi:hypothetical protein
MRISGKWPLLALAGIAAAIVVVATAAVIWRSSGAGHQGPKEIVGFVLNYQGQWVRENAKSKGDRLDFGMQLFKDDVLVPDGPDAWIELCLFSGAPKRIDAKQINGKTTVPAEKERQVAWAPRVWHALTADYRPIAVTAVSRDPVELGDAVVRLKDGQAELGNLLRAFRDGSYVLRLEPVVSEDTRMPQNRKLEVRVRWERGGAGSIGLPNVSPGLYKVRVCDASKLSCKGEGWVLLAKASVFEARRHAYQEAVHLVDTVWSREITTESKRNFLQAYLKQLAETE